MSTKKANLVTYDPSGVFLEETGVSPADLRALAPRLEDARREVLDDDLRLLAEGVVPKEKDPLDAAFLELPEKILAEYQADQKNSELGRILTTARRTAGHRGSRRRAGHRRVVHGRSSVDGSLLRAVL